MTVANPLHSVYCVMLRTANLLMSLALILVLLIAGGYTFIVKDKCTDQA